MKNILVLIVCVLLLSCGDEDTAEFTQIKNEVEVVYKNQGSYTYKGYLYMNTNIHVDAIYCDEKEFTVELPGVVKPYYVGGKILSSFIVTNGTESCEYKYRGDKKYFVQSKCEIKVKNELKVDGCLQLYIEGTRNFSVFYILKMK